MSQQKSTGVLLTASGLTGMKKNTGIAFLTGLIQIMPPGFPF